MEIQSDTQLLLDENKQMKATILEEVVNLRAQAEREKQERMLSLKEFVMDSHMELMKFSRQQMDKFCGLLSTRVPGAANAEVPQSRLAEDLELPRSAHRGFLEVGKLNCGFGKGLATSSENSRLRSCSPTVQSSRLDASESRHGAKAQSGLENSPSAYPQHPAAGVQDGYSMCSSPCDASSPSPEAESTPPPVIVFDEASTFPTDDASERQGQEKIEIQALSPYDQGGGGSSKLSRLGTSARTSGSNDYLEIFALAALDCNHTCEICGKTLKSRRDLKRHERIHTGEKPFVCQICQRSFARKDFLVKHQSVHTGLKPFACELCGSKFTQKSNLSKHMDIHRNLRRYKCRTCDKTFNQSANLRKHELTHSRPLACPRCNKRFAVRYTLKEHMKVHVKISREPVDAKSMLIHAES